MLNDGFVSSLVKLKALRIAKDENFEPKGSLMKLMGLLVT